MTLRRNLRERVFMKDKNEILQTQIQDATPTIISALNDGYSVLIRCSRNGIKMRKELSEQLEFRRSVKLKEGVRHEN